MKLIAMIPVRLSSKRIPKKNIRYLGGKPLIQYPIDLAVKSELFDAVWVTSEAAELQASVEALGACFHQRPLEYASDQATNREFTYDFFKSHPCDFVVMVNTTSPLLRQETLSAFIELVNENRHEVILSVVSEKAEAFYRGNPLNFDIHKKENSQMLAPVEKIVWALTAWERTSFMRRYEEGEEPVFGGGNIGRFAIPKDEACDLDTMEDWRIAEGMLQTRAMEESEPRFLKL